MRVQRPLVLLIPGLARPQGTPSPWGLFIARSDYALRETPVKRKLITAMSWSARLTWRMSSLWRVLTSRRRAKCRNCVHWQRHNQIQGKCYHPKMFRMTHQFWGCWKFLSQTK